jgi:hypothetical protein
VEAAAARYFQHASSSNWSRILRVEKNDECFPNSQNNIFPLGMVVEQGDAAPLALKTLEGGSEEVPARPLPLESDIVLLHSQNS